MFDLPVSLKHQSHSSNLKIERGKYVAKVFSVMKVFIVFIACLLYKKNLFLLFCLLLDQHCSVLVLFNVGCSRTCLFCLHG